MEMTEDRLRQECFMWFNNTYPQYRGLYFEIHNNAFSARSGAKHKATGRIAGVADNCLLCPKTPLPIFFEFKTETGKQSPVQKAWESLVRSFDYPYTIIRNLEEFQNLCRAILD